MGGFEASTRALLRRRPYARDRLDRKAIAEDEIAESD